MNEHKHHLRTLFQRLNIYGLKLNVSKCVFDVSELVFLGLLITPQDIKPLPEKVQAVLDYKLLKSIPGLKRILGLLNFYRRSIPHAAQHQFLLSQPLKGTRSKKRDRSEITWSAEAVDAFQKCKEVLTEVTFLAHPARSPALALHVDASDYATDVALHQIIDFDL